VYTYGITVPAQTNTLFLQNETISLTGLSGVTGASVGETLSVTGWTVQSWTSSSVIFVQSLALTSTYFNYGDAATVTS
jgi:hypothetical protein